MISKTSLTKNTKASILILGAGYIGKSIRHTLNDQNPNYNIVLLPASELNYHDKRTLWNHLITNKYDLIINASGFTGRPNVDQGEELKEDCWHYNVVSPANCASICSKLGLKHIQISSGCIYNGYDQLYSEEDTPNFGLFNNSSFYSKTKHAFESITSMTNVKILRIRMPISGIHDERSYLTKILKYDNLVDFKNSKTCVHGLGMFIYRLINDPHVTWGVQDIYNVANSDPLTTKEVVSLMAEFGVVNQNWNWVDIESLNITAPRSNCILNTTKADGIYKLPSERDAIVEALQNTQTL